MDVLATVLDRRNKLVSDLDKHDFKIFDDNSPQEIRFFSRQSDLPLRIGMLLDTSNSIRDRLKFEQEAAVDFLYSVLRRGKDQAFAMTFDDEPQIIQAFTGDGAQLRDEINKTRAGGGTAVYDAIYEACAKQLSNPPRPPGDQPDVVRRVMVLISDGDDNLSNHTRGEAIEMAQRTNVVIYTISTSTQWIQLSQTDPSKLANRKMHLTEGDQILKDLADETGGRAFSPTTLTISINLPRHRRRTQKSIHHHLQSFQFRRQWPLSQNQNRTPQPQWRPSPRPPRLLCKIAHLRSQLHAKSHAARPRRPISSAFETVMNFRT